METTKYIANIEILPGIILKFPDAEYSVISSFDGMALVCDKNSSKLIIKLCDLNYIYDEIRNNQVSIININNRVVERPSLSTAVNKVNENRLKFITNFINTYGPLYSEFSNSKFAIDGIKDLIDNSGLSKTTCWRLIRIFFQNGLDINSILDKRAYKCSNVNYKYLNKPGRKPVFIESKGCVLDRSHFNMFDDAIKVYSSGRHHSLKEAYLDIVRKQYGKNIIGPNGISIIMPEPDKYPTFSQFTHYYYKTVAKDKRTIIKTSNAEYRNNNRLTVSDNLANVKMAGDLWEIDECEVDLSLVSAYNPNVVVGRPIVYFMLDVYTRLIVGVGISFDNNSFEGFTNCMMSLLDDHTEICKKYNININPEQWPKAGLPTRLRCDYGAEYISKNVSDVLANLGITKELVTPGTGSLKGQVEQLFRQFQNIQRPLLEGRGLITKRHDSNHHNEACLSIYEFERLIYSFIIEHNTKYIDTYPLTKDMSINNIDAIPYKLWEYSVKKYGPTRIISNVDAYKYQLLYPIECKVSRNGIMYKDLIYYDDNNSYIKDLMIDAGLKKVPFSCKIDRRNISYIYYLNDYQVYRVRLSPFKTGMSDYMNLSLKDYETIRAIKKSKDYKMNYQNDIRLANTIAYNEAIIKSVPKSKRKAKEKVSDIRANRAIEKHLNDQNHLIFEDENELLPEQNVVLIENPNEEIGEIDGLEALRSFMERH